MAREDVNETNHFVTKSICEVMINIFDAYVDYYFVSIFSGTCFRGCYLVDIDMWNEYSLLTYGVVVSEFDDTSNIEPKHVMHHSEFESRFKKHLIRPGLEVLKIVSWHLGYNALKVSYKNNEGYPFTGIKIEQHVVVNSKPYDVIIYKLNATTKEFEMYIHEFQGNNQQLKTAIENEVRRLGRIHHTTEEGCYSIEESVGFQNHESIILDYARIVRIKL